MRDGVGGGGGGRGGVVEGVDGAGLPGGDGFDHGAVFQLQLHSDCAKGLQPGELPGRLDGFEGGGVAGLEGGDGGGDGEAGVVEGGPEEAGEDLGADGGGAAGAAGGRFVLLDEAVRAGGVEDVFEHHFAGLKGWVAEADLEELEDAGLVVVLVDEICWLRVGRAMFTSLSRLRSG